MIDYSPFWETVKSLGLSWNALVNEHGINKSKLHRMKNNKPITTETIDRFCDILGCDVSGILRHK